MKKQSKLWIEMEESDQRKWRQFHQLATSWHQFFGMRTYHSFIDTVEYPFMYISLERTPCVVPKHQGKDRYQDSNHFWLEILTPLSWGSRLGLKLEHKFCLMLDTPRRHAHIVSKALEECHGFILRESFEDVSANIRRMVLVFWSLGVSFVFEMVCEG